MVEPPSYPRVPHLVLDRGSNDDVLLDTKEIAALLRRPLLVEEKLDGANVVVWADGGVIECALRSGLDGMDRGRQLGPLRAWIAERYDALATAMSGVRAVYAEWLMLTHTVAYDRLDSYLVVLDVLSADGAFAAPAARDEWAASAGLVTPPALHRGSIEGIADLERLLGESRVGHLPMEGIAVRTLDGSAPRVAKLVRPGFRPIGKDEWRQGRPHNQLRERELSWH